MQKPKNYDNVKAPGEWVPVEPGAHYMRIIGAKIKATKTGKEQLVVIFDFDQNDKQAGYFAKQFEQDDRPERNWPYLGTSYMLTESYIDYNGKERNRVEEFCHYVEWSNKGFVVQFEDKNGKELPDEAFCAQFKGKLIGGVYGLVESEFDGKISKRAELRWFCTYDKVPAQKVPQEKLLKGSASSYRPQQQTSVHSVQGQAAQEPAQASLIDEPDIPF